jgi:hypothetical protein
MEVEDRGLAITAPEREGSHILNTLNTQHPPTRLQTQPSRAVDQQNQVNSLIL